MVKLSAVLAKAGMSEADVKAELSGEVQEFQGKKLDTPIKYSFDPDQFESVDEAKNAGDWPNEGNILKSLNGAKKTSAKAQAYQNATKALREAYEQTSEYKKAQLVKALVQAGKSQAEADAFAETILGAAA